MPKLSGNNSMLIEIGIEQIVETGNVRKQYTPEEIKELATSIFKCNLISPIAVKKMELDEYGVQKYELIAGHRRIRAIKQLIAEGYDYSRVKAVVVTGDKAILQLVENIQRQDLTSEDKEKALLELIKKGMTQKEISEELAKPLSWVSDTLAGNRVRETLEAQGINTEDICTPALSQLRSIPAEQLPSAINQVKQNGSTVKAATKVLKEFRKEKKPSIPEPEFEVEPVMITLENILAEISEYKIRTSELYKKDSTHTAIIKTICDDLIELFRAYEA